jgi:hypothetical protein
MEWELCEKPQLWDFSSFKIRQSSFFFPLQNPVAALTFKVVCFIHSP